MAAPDRFVQWLASYEFVDRNKKLPAGLRLQYHSRSDEHSKVLGEFIVEDLLATCPTLRDQASRGQIAYGINYRFHWANGKTKALDLVIGIPTTRELPPAGARIRRLNQSNVNGSGRAVFHRLLIACEEKAVMTEHSKSQPRVFSELNDAHAIVHAGSRDTIAAGIAVVNIAATFVSPLRQTPGTPIKISTHRQPDVTANMVKHLRRLPIRTATNQPGFDAFCTFVVELDNQGHAALHVSVPAPQPGDTDHYDTFLATLCSAYAARYSNLEDLSDGEGLSIEEALVRLANAHPGLLTRVGDLAVQQGFPGANELSVILESIQAGAETDQDPRQSE